MATRGNPKPNQQARPLGTKSAPHRPTTGGVHSKPSKKDGVE